LQRLGGDDGPRLRGLAVITVVCALAAPAPAPASSIAATAA